MAAKSGFFGSLFEFSFSEFVTPRLISLLYGVSIFVAGALTLTFIGGGFGTHPILGLLALIISPLVFLFLVIVYRVQMEVIIVMFRIAEHTRETADAVRRV